MTTDVDSGAQEQGGEQKGENTGLGASQSSRSRAQELGHFPRGTVALQGGSTEGPGNSHALGLRVHTTMLSKQDASDTRKGPQQDRTREFQADHERHSQKARILG